MVWFSLVLCGAVHLAYCALHLYMCMHGHVADSYNVESSPAMYKRTKTLPCVLRENVSSFDRLIDTQLLEST